MANSASTPKKNAGSTGSRSNTPPSNSKWWQLFFIYPTLGVALITAAPEWIEKVGGFAGQILNPEKVVETQLVRFMEKNPKCVNSPIYWVETTSQTKVDGTICNDTGDVWLRIQGANGKIAYRGIDISDAIINQKEAANRFSLFDMSAHAKPYTAPLDRKRQDRKIWERYQSYAQQIGMVICQKYADNTTLVRHIKTNNTCYDEYVDTRTGVVISTQEVFCRQSC